MPANTSTITFDRLYSTTTANHRPELAMEIVQSNALLWHMYRQGAVHYAGGTEVRCPVVLVESQNVSAVGLYETFGTTPEDAPDIARYPTWYKNRCSVVFDETELAQNSGPEQVLDLLKVKLSIAKHSLVNDLSRQMYANNAAAPKEINGLQSGFFEFAAEAAQAAVVGGIQKGPTGYTRWVNRYQAITSFSTDGLRQMERVYGDASLKGTHPDIIMMDPTVYRFFKELVAPNQERKDTLLWNQGFDNLLFNNTPCVPEPELEGTGQIYMITTTGRRVVNDFNLKPEYWKTPGKNPMAQSKATGTGLQLAVLRKDDFRMTDFRYPPDSDTLLAHTFFTCMFTASSLQRQGCLDFGANPIAF